MTKLARLAAVLLLGSGALFPAPLSADNATIGVVLMHGKWGSPSRNIDGLAGALEAKGFLVATPEMPWSGRRLYDKSADEAMAEIDAEVAKLREKGAKRIVIAGHSLGAAGALAYASRNPVDAVVAIAPGHIPEGKRYAVVLGDSVNKAKELVAAGKGDEGEWFGDLNTGNRRDNIKVTPRSYVSYFDPDGPMRFSRNTAGVKGGAPVLWIVPQGEEQPLRDAVLRFYERLPANPNNKLVQPGGGHIAAPGNARSDIIAWIESVLAKN